MRSEFAETSRVELPEHGLHRKAIVTPGFPQFNTTLEKQLCFYNYICTNPHK